MNIEAGRSKFKKVTANYKIDNVLDIIDIPASLSKNRYITKIPLSSFLYEKNINTISNNNIVIYQNNKFDINNLKYEKINFEKLNNNKFKINFKTLEFQNSYGYKIKFTDLYYPIDIIGTGSFGLVISAVKLSTHEKIAIKIVDKKKDIIDISILNNEVNVIKKLNNKRILKIYEVLDTHKYFYIFMELIEGGSLKDLIINRYKNPNTNYLFRDSECAEIMKGLLESLEYLHKNCIIHRDIKPENIMFKNKDDLSSLILCDFGLAYKMQDEKFISSKCGTILYMAPEMIKNRKYDYLVDSFSAGIVLYILTSGGKHPIFENSMTTEDYIKKLKSKENFNFTVEMPLLARNLFLKLCKFDPLFRYEIYKALQHPWITRNENGQIPLVIIDEYKKVDKIKNFKSLLSVSFFLNFYKNKYLVKKAELLNNENTLFLNNNNNNSISIKEILVNSKSKIFNIKNKKTLKFIDFNDSFEKNDNNNIVNKNNNNLHLLKTFNNKSNKNINNNDFIKNLKKNNRLNDSKTKNIGKSFYLKGKSKSKSKKKLKNNSQDKIKKNIYK